MRSMEMYAAFFVFRLSSTLFKNGYIPVDRSGDFMYQFFDALSLALVLNLLYAVHKKYMHSYQEEFDTLPLKPMIFPCVVVACFVHGTFNKNKFFDVTWAISTNLETFTLVPQLWMLAKMGGKVDNMTGHFVALGAALATAARTRRSAILHMVKRGTVTHLPRSVWLPRRLGDRKSVV